MDGRDSRTFAKVIALLGVAVVWDQATLLLTNIYPPQWGTIQWRYGAVGLALGQAPAFLLADAALIGAALLGGWRLMAAGLAWTHLLVAAVLLGTIAAFSLDTLQLRGTVELTRQQLFLLTSARTLVTGLLLAVVAGALGLLLWPRGTRTRERPTASQLVVGSDD